MVFHPTYDEFKDLNKFIASIEKKGAHIPGIAKIVPPKEWQPRRAGYTKDELNLSSDEKLLPIKQIFSATPSRGAYKTSCLTTSPTTLSDLYDLAHSRKFCPPSNSSPEDLEKKFWANVNASQPLYGADVQDSLMDNDSKYWNIQKLDSILIDCMEGESIPGVNTPYLYFGMWRTSFCWHVEDMDLYAINFHHHGAPKQWYCVPPAAAHKLELVAARLFEEQSNCCSQFMRHKTCMINPEVCRAYGVTVHSMLQTERDIIVVFPHAYHSGFNHGFNIAESTNFALPRWVEHGKRFRGCDCGGREEAVSVEMNRFVERVQPERLEMWMRGEDLGSHPDDPDQLKEMLHDAFFRANMDMTDTKVRDVDQKAILKEFQKLYWEQNPVPEEVERQFALEYKVTGRQDQDGYTKTKVFEDKLKPTDKYNLSWKKAGCPFGKYKHAVKACRKCEACKSADCGDCYACRDKPKFGGPGTAKQRCELKICPYPVRPPCNYCDNFVDEEIQETNTMKSVEQSSEEPFNELVIKQSTKKARKRKADE